MANTGLKVCAFLGNGGTGGRPRFQEGLRTWPLATLSAMTLGLSTVGRLVGTADTAVVG